MRNRVLAALVAALLFLAAQPSWAQSIPGCNLSSSTIANYSATVGTGQTTLIPAPAYGVVRTGIFIELLTASAKLGINPGGGTASTSTGGNIVISTGSAAPNDVTSFNFSSLGFLPTGAITVTADAGSRVVTAFACPQ